MNLPESEGRRTACAMPRTILIVDDVATNRIVLKVKLGAAFYDTVMAGTGGEALAQARAVRPDLVLLDHALPDMDGIAVTRALRADPVLRDIPVIMFTAGRGDAVKLEALAAGCDDFLCKPLDDRMLLARIRNLLRDRDAAGSMDTQAGDLRACGLAEPAAGFESPGRIAVIAGRADLGLRWRAALGAHLPDRIEVLSREEALAHAGGAAPDLYVIAADLAGQGSGLQLMSDLRSHPDTRHAAVCLVMPADGATDGAMALDLGVNALVAGIADGRETALRARALIRRKRIADQHRATLRQGLQLAVIDPLTGLHNRRFALPALGRMMRDAQAAGSSCAVMVIDIDRFKGVNDSHGHAAGDRVLAEVARRLREALRPGDLIARIGGEEFLAVLPTVTEVEARDIAERLCRAVSLRPVPLPASATPRDGDPVGTAEAGGWAFGLGDPGRGHPVAWSPAEAPAAGGWLRTTVSIGLALSGPSPDSVPEVIGRADRALLAAKAEGRNQVTLGQSAA